MEYKNQTENRAFQGVEFQSFHKNSVLQAHFGCYEKQPHFLQQSPLQNDFAREWMKENPDKARFMKPPKFLHKH